MTITPANIDNSPPYQVASEDLDVLTIQDLVKIPVKRIRSKSLVSAKEHTPPTWKEISYLVDVSSFLVFVLVAVLSFTMFIAIAQQGE